jgi:predicted ATPase
MLVEDTYVAGNPDYSGSRWMTVISGCSSSGKSSLLSELASRGYCVQPEAGRQIVKEQMSIGGDGLPWANVTKFIELCVSRAMFYFNTAAPKEKPAVFDRSIIDPISGYEHLGLPMPLHMAEAVRRYRYAKRVFLTPPWPELFVNDKERLHSFEDAELEYHTLVRNYRAYGYEVVFIPKASVSERADFFEEWLDG